ncbi:MULTISPECIES: SDR family oxidoreductase [Lactiplantibacillus]|uniref:SDR family oxidoreductase n=1 Tax=Lactiplantibacillus pentosus TaxID=1589 RepID=A0AAW8WBR2_LACPE|nr:MULTISPECIES: SDR family oxidoreductase [Lactiplantibacillus]MBU7460997.1 SDR family oxidoreductase [Lactiplantibacillus pentosus]MBU7477379.1 SDR family oxidoreductase [Lactiplantibacillus pentosus]MBU7483782.1 SDR family oxidoreductase [Lactiplantibacillus sp. 30.2.29]MBU7486877.1 SDR family oxidoreductase [Lactiplantibacillus pentosus]MBU7499925.1 SDR family oxidoreductase [Lactiplantibacillus pentosus]
MQTEDWLGLKDRVIIVTGGSSGIGNAIVESLLNAGAKVVDADLHPSKIQDENLAFVQTDVTSKDAVDNMVSESIKNFGTVDGVVNNAGINIPRILVDPTDPDGKYVINESNYEKMFDVNVKSVFLVSSAVAKVLVNKKHGVIVNMSSESGLEGSQGASMYSGTKGAINGFTRAWSKELGQYNVRVVGVAPGVLEATALRTLSYEEGLAYSRHETIEELRAGYAKTSTIPLGRSGKLSEVANLVTYFLSDRSSYMTGQTVNVSGGKSRG